MDRSYWEKIAPGYNEEIFDVLHNDKKAIIRSAIENIASPSKTVIDAGCAIGKWLPVLSPAFRKVYAADISATNLDIAKKNYPEYRNIEYRRVDLSGSSPKLPKCDTAICINAILTDSLKKRSAFFKNLSRAVKKQGHLVLVVPSLESWLLTHIIQQQWKIDAKVFNRKTTNKLAATRYNNLTTGNADIDNVPTKHYLREELVLLLSKEGFAVQDIQKIEYSWKTEFVNPPKWLREPRPWDWMCVAGKL